MEAWLGRFGIQVPRRGMVGMTTLKLVFPTGRVGINIYISKHG